MKAACTVLATHQQRFPNDLTLAGAGAVRGHMGDLFEAFLSPDFCGRAAICWHGGELNMAAMQTAANQTA